MKCKTTTTITLTVFLFLILFFSPNVFANIITVPTNAYFGFMNGCYINFSTQKTFSTIYRVNSYWYFNGYGFQVENANMTITQFFTSNQLKFTLTADSGISTTKIYTNTYNQPTAIIGTSSWTYNPTTKILTLSVVHSSSQSITISWITSATTGINLYFLAGSSIGFQSLGDDSWLPIDAYVTVSSGTLQGYDVGLTMGSDGGDLRFTSLDTAVLIPHNVTILGGTTINGITTTHAGDKMVFRWKAQSYQQIAIDWWFNNLPVWLGLIGVAMMLSGSVLTVKSFQDGEMKGALIFALVLIPIGFALIVGWIFA